MTFLPRDPARQFRARDLLGICSLYLAVCLLLSCCTTIDAAENDSMYQDAREYWEERMVEYGHKWGRALNPKSGRDQADMLQMTYYDAAWVFYRIADLTGQREPWYTYATRAITAYRKGYLEKASYSVPGYWRFPHGLYEDNLRGGSTIPEAIRLIRDKPAFSNVYELRPGSGYFGEWESMSREVAYVIQANIVAERYGLDRVIESGTPRLASLIGFTEKQLHEWRTQEFASPEGGRFAPFMFGLTAQALVEFYEWELENGRDPNDYWQAEYWPNIISALDDVSTWAFNEAKVREGTNAGRPMWVESYRGSGGLGAYRYDDTADGSTEIAPDLNLLIAPVHGWLLKMTGEEKHRAMGDAVFAGGVRNASVDWSGKIFNQNYRWSFDYVRWREDADTGASDQ